MAGSRLLLHRINAVGGLVSLRYECRFLLSIWATAFEESGQQTQDTRYGHVLRSSVFANFLHTLVG